MCFSNWSTHQYERLWYVRVRPVELIDRWSDFRMDRKLQDGLPDGWAVGWTDRRVRSNRTNHDGGNTSTSRSPLSYHDHPGACNGNSYRGHQERVRASFNEFQQASQQREEKRDWRRPCQQKVCWLGSCLRLQVSDWLVGRACWIITPRLFPFPETLNVSAASRLNKATLTSDLGLR